MTTSAFALAEHAQRLLFTEARSATRFAADPVDPDVIRQVFDLAKWGPTGNNSVPMRVVIARSPQARQAVIDAASVGNQPRLDAAPMIVVLARDERFHDHFPTIAPGADEAAARLEANPDERAMRAERGTWLQAAYFIIALRAAGLAVRPYGGFTATAVDDALLADSSWRSQLILGVGYPTDDHGAGERKGRVSADIAVTEL